MIIKYLKSVSRKGKFYILSSSILLSSCVGSQNRNALEQTSKSNSRRINQILEVRTNNSKNLESYIKTVPTRLWRCKHCNAPNSLGAEVCISCGAKKK